MPIGALAAVPHLARYFVYERPVRVLDLGIGFGFYGSVVRQWCDEGVQPWRTWLTGVEVWADYRSPCWDLYDAVFVRTIQEYLNAHTEQFDCVLLNDVLEHFERDEGTALLQRLKLTVTPGGALFVCTPGNFVAQGAAHGNPFEKHRCVWTSEELEGLDFETILSGTEQQEGPEPAVLSRWNAGSE